MSSIQKRPNGKWRARYTDPLGHERAQHFDRRDDAVQFLARQLVRMRDGTWVDPLHGRRTFGDYAAVWLDSQLHHRASTTKSTRQRLHTHLLPRFGDMPLASIQRTDVQKWVNEKAKTHAASTVEALYSLLAQILGDAVDNLMLSSTPCRRINLPEREARKVVIPTIDEVAALIHAAPDRAKAMIATLAATGLRNGEIGGLTVDRVDFLRRTVTVDRQLVGTSLREPRFGPPKTKASNRVIPVPAALVETMAAHLSEFPSETVVFRTAHGSPWTRKTLNGEWRDWLAKAAVAFNPHDLRHFYASGLIAAGLSPKVIQARLGHATITETMDTYGHLWPDDEDRTRDAAGALLEGISRTADGLAARKSWSQA